MIDLVNQAQPFQASLFGAWLTRQKRKLLRSLIADAIASRDTKPKPVSERVGPLLTLAFGLTSICFVAYLGAAVAIPEDMQRPFRAVSRALDYSLYCLAVLLLVEYKRRTLNNPSKGLHRVFLVAAQLTLVIQIVMAAYVVAEVGIRFTEEDFKDDPGVKSARDRAQCSQRRLEEVERIAEQTKEADQSVTQCDHQLDAHIFTIRLAQEKGELTRDKADELRKIAWRLCLPYLNASDDHRLRMELAYAKTCDPEIARPVD